MKKILLISLLALTTLLILAGCNPPVLGNDPFFPDIHLPGKQLNTNEFEPYVLAYCWVATDYDAFGDARTDIIIRFDDNHSVRATYPTTPPTTPVSMGCLGAREVIRTGLYGLKWRNDFGQLTMFGSAKGLRGDNFYFVQLPSTQEKVLETTPIWDHERYFYDPASLSWSPTEEWLVTDGIDADSPLFGANIWLYNPETREGRQLTDIQRLSPYMNNPTWSPDGGYIAFLYGPEPSGLGIIRLSDNRQIDLTPETSSEIASWRFKLGETFGIYDNVMGISAEEALQFYLQDIAEPQWDTLRKRIIFPAPTGKNRVALFSVGYEGADLQELFPTLQGLMSLPKLSPSGDKLAFVRYEGWNKRDRAEILVYDWVSKRLNSLVVLPAPNNGEELYISGMDWTPDGNYLAFSSNHGGESDIYVVTVDGVAWVNLT
ncbi:MAG: hypothetical protein GXP42_09600, partial [Chloroflexi bacterium]|nr:hypothetical protein [Chloroflexota bacterium]